MFTYCLYAVSINYSAKFDEIDDNIPMIQQLQKNSKFRLSYEGFKQNEIHILKELDWDINVQTPIHFLKSLLGQGIVFQNDHVLSKKIVNDDKESNLLSDGDKPPDILLTEEAQIKKVDEKTLQDVNKSALQQIDQCLLSTQFFLTFPRPRDDLVLLFNCCCFMCTCIEEN